MSNWIDNLRGDLQTEFNTKPPTAVLATVRYVNSKPAPTARTIIVRDIQSNGAMLFDSDARSQKHGELHETPAATLLFWCTSVKRQYRVNGIADIAVDQRQKIWTGLSGRARAMFAWPVPLSPQSKDDAVAGELPADSPMPYRFEVIRLMPDSVDVVDLNPNPHARTIWQIKNGQWKVTAVNP